MSTNIFIIKGTMGYREVGNVLVYGWTFNEEDVAKLLGLNKEASDWEEYYVSMW
jgi:hypothetical protein